MSENAPKTITEKERQALMDMMAEKKRALDETKAKKAERERKIAEKAARHGIDAKKLEEEIVAEKNATVPTPEPVQAPEFLSPQNEKPKSTEADYETFKKNLYLRQGYESLTGKEHRGLASKIVEAIEHTEKFNDGSITPGQKIIIVRNLLDTFQNELSEKAEEKFNSDHIHHAVDTGGNWFSKKAKQAQSKALNMWGGIRHDGLVDKYQQEFLKNLETGGGMQEFLDRNFNRTVDTVRDIGIEARVEKISITGNEKGSYRLDFAGEEVAGSKNAKIIEEYNKWATLVAQSTDYAGREGASLTEKLTVARNNKGFKNAEQKMMAVFLERAGGDEEKASVMAGLTRERINEMRFLVKNPDAAETLRKIGMGGGGVIGNLATSVDKFAGRMLTTESLGFKGLSTVLRYGAIGYGVGGVITLAGGGVAAAGAIAVAGGVVASGAIAGAIGALRGKSAAEKNLAKEDSKVQKGQSVGAVTEKSVIEVGETAARIAELSEKLNDAAGTGSAIEMEKIAGELRAVLKYAKEKKNAEEINYGGEEGRFGRRQELFMAMHGAEATLYTRESFAETEASYAYEYNKLHYGERASRTEVTAARSKKIRGQAFESAKMGFIFGSIGSYASHWWHGTPDHATVGEQLAAKHEVEYLNTLNQKIGAETLKYHPAPEQLPSDWHAPMPNVGPKINADALPKFAEVKLPHEEIAHTNTPHHLNKAPVAAAHTLKFTTEKEDLPADFKPDIKEAIKTPPVAHEQDVQLHGKELRAVNKIANHYEKDLLRKHGITHHEHKMIAAMPIARVAQYPGDLVKSHQGYFNQLIHEGEIHGVPVPNDGTTVGEYEEQVRHAVAIRTTMDKELVWNSEKVAPAPHHELQTEHAPGKVAPVKSPKLELPADIAKKGYGEISSVKELKSLLKGTSVLSGGLPFKTQLAALEKYAGDHTFTVVKSTGGTEPRALLGAQSQMRLAAKEIAYNPKENPFFFERKLEDGSTEIIEVRPHEIAPKIPKIEKIAVTQSHPIETGAIAASKLAGSTVPPAPTITEEAVPAPIKNNPPLPKVPRILRDKVAPLRNPATKIPEPEKIAPQAVPPAPEIAQEVAPEIQPASPESFAIYDTVLAKQYSELSSSDVEKLVKTFDYDSTALNDYASFLARHAKEDFAVGVGYGNSDASASTAALAAIEKHGILIGGNEYRVTTSEAADTSKGAIEALALYPRGPVKNLQEVTPLAPTNPVPEHAQPIIRHSITDHSFDNKTVGGFAQEYIDNELKAHNLTKKIIKGVAGINAKDVILNPNYKFNSPANSPEVNARIQEFCNSVRDKVLPSSFAKPTTRSSETFGNYMERFFTFQAKLHAIAEEKMKTILTPIDNPDELTAFKNMKARDFMENPERFKYFYRDTEKYAKLHDTVKKIILDANITRGMKNGVPQEDMPMSLFLGNVLDTVAKKEYTP